MIDFIKNQDRDLIFKANPMGMRVSRGSFGEPIVVMPVGSIEVILGEYGSVPEAAKEIMKALLQPSGTYTMSGYSNSDDAFGW